MGSLSLILLIHLKRLKKLSLTQQSWIISYQFITIWLATILLLNLRQQMSWLEILWKLKYFNLESSLSTNRILIQKLCFALKVWEGMVEKFIVDFSLILIYNAWVLFVKIQCLRVVKSTLKVLHRWWQQ